MTPDSTAEIEVEVEIERIEPVRSFSLRSKLIWLLPVVFVSIFGFIVATQAPTLQQGKTLSVEKGMSVAEITEKAEDEGVVRSSFLLYAVLEYMYSPTNIYAGSYSFDRPHSVFGVAKKFAKNDINQELVSITIPEGSARKDIVKSVLEQNPKFDGDLFLKLTEGKEGYLFPETYFLPLQFTAQELVTFIEKTYQEKITPLRPRIELSTLSEYEVLILASLLERETNSEESMKIVAGILANRMNIKMALQVDASLEYILNKPLKELTPDDLKIDSPYNTYLYAGLPPTPIGNPGLSAIEAVLTPTPSEYFFYITDNDGQFHYAKTFEEHKQNVARYLK